MASIPRLRSSADKDGDVRSVPVPTARAVVDSAVYIDGKRLPGRHSPASGLEQVRSQHRGFVWVGLHEPNERQMHDIAETFGLHELVIEDAVHAHERPKLEQYDDTLVLLLKTVNYVEHESMATARQVVESGEIMVIVGPDFVITVRHGDHTGLKNVRLHMEELFERLQLGPFAVMHAIADHVVDTYLEVIASVETDVDAMEENIFSPESRLTIEPIYLLKREIVELRRAITPLDRALIRMTAPENVLVPKEIRRFFRDVRDHHEQAVDRIASYDDVVSSLIDAALAKVGIQQNTDMRKISAWVAIASVPTMVAGIYGMNFDNMPELTWKYSYFVVLAVLVTVCVVLWRTFRKNDWL